MDVTSHFRLQIVECRQAVHEAGTRLAGGFHQRGRHLIRHQLIDALLPDLVKLAHRHPDIGVEKIGTRYRFKRVGIYHDARARGERQYAHLRHQLNRRLQSVWGGNSHVHTHLRAADQQRAAHVEARITQVAKRQLVQRLFTELFHR